MGSILNCLIRSCCDDDSDDEENYDNNNDSRRRRQRRQNQLNLSLPISAGDMFRNDGTTATLVVSRSAIFRSTSSDNFEHQPHLSDFENDNRNNSNNHPDIDDSSVPLIVTPSAQTTTNIMNSHHEQPPPLLVNSSGSSSSVLNDTTSDTNNHTTLTTSNVAHAALNVDSDEEDDTRTNCCHPPSTNPNDSRNSASSTMNNRSFENRNTTASTVASTTNTSSSGRPNGVDSINTFFRKIRDRWHTTTSTTYDSFAAVTASWNQNNAIPPSYNTRRNRSSSLSTDLMTQNSSESTDDSIPDRRGGRVVRRGGSQGQLRDYISGGSENAPRSGNSSTSRSQAIKIKTEKVLSMNSPLRQAVSFDNSKDIPTISPAEIVLPGSLLQQQMAEQMSALLKLNTDDNTNNNGNALDGEDECVICMENFDETNPRMPTLCGCGENKTYFHLPCLYQWIEQSKYCPTCRESLTWEEF